MADTSQTKSMTPEDYNSEKQVHQHNGSPNGRQAQTSAPTTNSSYFESLQPSPPQNTTHKITMYDSTGNNRIHLNNG